MTSQNPIDIDAPVARRQNHIDLKVYNLLAPRGNNSYFGDTFTQVEFDFLESFVLRQIKQFCQNNIPHNPNDHSNRCHMYIEVWRAFSLTNIHSFTLVGFTGRGGEGDGVHEYGGEHRNQGTRGEPSNSANA